MAKRIIQLDLKKLSMPDRHSRIFNSWEELKAGDTLIITNDHDPKPLWYQFEVEYKGKYNWEYEQKGPKDWIVKIKRI